MKRLNIIIVIVAALLVMKSELSIASILTVSDESSWQSEVGTWGLADFEGFLGPIGTHYPGVTFVDFNGGSPFTIAQFPYQGTNSMFTVFQENAGGGGWAAEFTTPVRGVAFWSGDVQFPGTIVAFYDSAHTLIGMFDLLDSGDGNGPYLYGFNGFVSESVNIARVELAINEADAIWFDNLKYSPAAPVPLPATILLLLPSLAGIVAVRGRFQSKKQD